MNGLTTKDTKDTKMGAGYSFVWLVLFVVHRFWARRAEGFNHERHERHENGCVGFLSCSWCFSWFTKFCHKAMNGLSTKDTKDTKKGARVFFRVVRAFRGSPSSVATS